MEIITFDSLPNTNDYLRELTKKDANSWTVIHAKNQTEGRGYAGNEWKAERNLNLTFSFLLKTKLEYKDLVVLNEWIAYCIYIHLKKYTPNVAIKWPNDIIVNDKKVCGVLIENFKSNNQMHSIIGIGINVNQTDFNQLPKASSLAKETAINYDIVSLMTELLAVFQDNYLLLIQEQFDLIHTLYNENLYKRGDFSTFRIDDKLVEGKILSSTKGGTLLVEIDGITTEFLHKQIELIF